MNQPLDDNFYDAAEQRKLREDKKDAQLLRRRDLDDARWVLSNARGKRFIWRLWSICGTFQASYVPKDATQTAFLEGKRDIGLALLLLINEADPLAYSRMVTEYNSEIKKKKSGEPNGE